MRVPTAGENEFREVARVDGLGKPGETITAVRFFDDIAYVVTFLRTDPFYAIDLKDNLSPKILGELSISGFSEYLHAINSDKTLMLAVGQEADDEGGILGIQLTLFDSTDPTSPKALHRYVIEDDAAVSSSSTASYDFKAFRYVSINQTTGIVIFPLRIYSPSSQAVIDFDGYAVFDVSTVDGIRPRMRVSHPNQLTAYYNGCHVYLPHRSWVINGDLMTIDNGMVISTDLDTRELKWNLTLPKPCTFF